MFGHKNRKDLQVSTVVEEAVTKAEEDQRVLKVVNYLVLMNAETIITPIALDTVQSKNREVKHKNLSI